MRLMASFFRAYPLQTLLMLTALLLSGLAEGIGLSTLLPLLNIALGHTGAALPGLPADSQSNFGQQMLELLAAAEIAPTLGNMLLIIVGSVALKCVFLLLAQSQVGYTAAQMGTDLRLEMLRAVLRSQWEYFLHQPIGKLTNALASEAQRASDAFVCGATAITFLLQAVIYGAVAFALSWQASLLAIGIGMIIIGLSHFLVKISGRAGTQQTRLLTSLVANLTDTLQSVKPLKAMAREHLAGSVLAREARRLNKALRRQVLSVAVLNSMARTAVHRRHLFRNLCRAAGIRHGLADGDGAGGGAGARFFLPRQGAKTIAEAGPGRERLLGHEGVHRHRHQGRGKTAGRCDTDV